MVQKIMPSFSDEIDEICKGLDIAVDEIKKCIANERLSKRCVDYILEVCWFWTGNTYVGIKKQEEVQKGFQSFFENLMKLLLTLRDSNKTTSQDKKTINNLLYQGPVYRYLGHGISQDHKKPIKLEYNDLYVSWSKYPQNSYLESKLYGKKLLLHGNISGSCYGIDLEKLGVSRANEGEVVFPTIKEYIVEVEIYE